MKVDPYRKEELDDVKAVMGTAGGRRFVWRILEQARIFGSTFNEVQAISAFQEGQRNIGLFIFADIMEASPEKYLTMVNGVKEREERRNGRTGSGDNGNTGTADYRDN